MARKVALVRTPTSATENGFTLVELLAVLAILSIAVVSFMLNGTGGSDTAKFRGFLVTTASALTESRTRAMKNATEETITIDTKNRAIISGNRTIKFPKDVELSATIDGLETGAASIRFFPAGTSTGGKLVFTHRGKSYEILVNWLTGNVALHPV
jgi:general secretion pathway protein H